MAEIFELPCRRRLFFADTNYLLRSGCLQLKAMERSEGIIQIITLGRKFFILRSFPRKTITAIRMVAKNALILGRMNRCQTRLNPSRRQRYCVFSAIIRWISSTWQHTDTGAASRVAGSSRRRVDGIDRPWLLHQLGARCNPNLALLYRQFAFHAQ